MMSNSNPISSANLAIFSAWSHEVFGLRIHRFLGKCLVFNIKTYSIIEHRPLLKGSFSKIPSAMSMLWHVVTTYFKQPPWTLPIVGDPHLVDKPDPAGSQVLPGRVRGATMKNGHHSSNHGNAASNTTRQIKWESNVTKEIGRGSSFPWFFGRFSMWLVVATTKPSSVHELVPNSLLWNP